VHSASIPDVLGSWYGVSFALEAEYDESGSAALVLGQVEKRLKAGFGVLRIAVIYPVDLGWSTKPAEVELLRAISPAFERSVYPPAAWP
jgi:hypothetical protein